LNIKEGYASDYIWIPILHLIVSNMKNGFICHSLIYTRMDEPKTRRQSKKDQKEKARPGVYTTKHVRIAEALKLTHLRK
jgi:hypothetical protein